MSKVNILVFAADPLSAPPDGLTPRLRLDEDVREIRQKVRAAEHRDALEFDIRWATRTDDLLQALNEIRPQVVHFSGHGGDQGLVLVAADGHGPHRVDAAVLGQLFDVFRGDIRVVVLSSCFSLPQAEAVAAAVGCAIGTRGEISDEAAITFNAAFYRAIAFGQSLQAAYEQARLALRLEHFAERECPELVVRHDVDPATLVLVSPGQSDLPNDDGQGVIGPRAVANIAQRARAQDLRPKILERVARPFVQSEYLPLIGKLRALERRTLAIVGDAGYGKTTMLGEIYDHLADEVPWIGVLSCADVYTDKPATTEDLARRMGELVSGSPVPLPEACASLNEACGNGVLLVDTLDLLLGGSWDRGVDLVLADVVETGTTLVLTCREYEFAQFATPGPTRAGPRLGFVLRDAPPFTDAEVRAAAERYVTQHGGGDEDAVGFAESLLTLSAGSFRLEQIVRNPLLLALLCELFATEGYAVPADLTVSKLYEVYWNARVAESRRHPGTPVPLRKSMLCREIAAILLRASRDHVKTRIRRDDLPVNATQVDRDALDELLSDGVLRESAGGGVEFFHQTFLEYTMARWLNISANRADRQDLLRGTWRGGSGTLHAWPIVRQVLTTADPDEVPDLVTELDLADPMAFKVVALSAVAAEQHGVLERLADIARERGTGFREALLFAVSAAPRAIALTAWRAVLGLMEGESFGVAMQAAKPLAVLLGQMDGPPAPRVREAVSAFLRLEDDDAGEEDGGSVALGTLMKHLEGPLSRRADSDTLALLRGHFGAMAKEAKAMVILLHVRRGDAPARAALVRQVLEGEMPTEMLQPLLELVHTAAADSAPDSGDALAPLRRMEEPLPKGWLLIQARLAGWDAAKDEGRLRALVEALLTGDPRLLDKVHLALRIAIESGAGRQVAELLTREPVSSVPENRRHAVSRLLSESSGALGPQERQQVSDWLLRAEPLPGELLAALAAVADEARAREAVCSGLPGVSAPMRYQIVARTVNSLPTDFGRAVMDAATRAPVQRGHEGDAETMWAAWFHRLALDGDEEALRRLVRLAAGQRKKPALHAAESVATLSSGRSLPLESLLPIAGSPYPGVRQTLLRAALGQLEHGWPVPEEALDSIAAAYADETNSAVLPPFFSLVAKWVQVHGHVPDRAAAVTAALPTKLRAAGKFDRGMAKGVAHVLKVMAQSGDEKSLPRVEAWTLDLFASLDARLMNGSQASMSELLVQLAQADPTFLERAFERAPGLPPRNIRVLAKTILRTLGPSSPLLARIATAEWCPPEVRQVVLGFQGT
jgi:hypothetical protein